MEEGGDRVGCMGVGEEGAGGGIGGANEGGGKSEGWGRSKGGG